MKPNRISDMSVYSTYKIKPQKQNTCKVSHKVTYNDRFPKGTTDWLNIRYDAKSGDVNQSRN